MTLAGRRVLLLQILRTRARPTRQAVIHICIRAALVVYGHGPIARWEWREVIASLNPGSAGPSRFGPPRRVGLRDISVEQKTIHLACLLWVTML